jgi:hypothetical protein
MSRANSSVLTVRCDRFGCEEKQIYVQAGQLIVTDSDWGSVTVDSEHEYDLCPAHMKDLVFFFCGPEEEDKDKTEILER